MGASPREVCAAADAIFITVTNPEALEFIFEGPDGLLAGLSLGKVLMCTVSPTASQALATKVREKGSDMLDARCPVAS